MVEVVHSLIKLYWALWGITARNRSVALHHEVQQLLALPLLSSSSWETNAISQDLYFAARRFLDLEPNSSLKVEDCKEKRS